MSRAKGLFLWAGAAVGLSGVAFAAEPTTTASNDEVRAIVAEMMADAQGRSSLLQGGATAGHDGRFFVASPDGSFRLNVGGQIQFRYLVNIDDEDDATPGQEDDFDVGFQTRRTKLDFTGNVINKDWTFRVLQSFDRDGGSAGLEEAWVQYNFGNGWKARWGQFKLPLLREELVSSSRQLAVERSVLNEAFTQDRSQGIEFAYEQEDWNLKLAFSDGLDSENTDFTDQSLRSNTGFRVMGEADYAFTGRFEYKFAGTWSRFADFTSRQGDDFAALVGVAGHWQQGPNTSVSTDIDRQTFQFTFDASLEGDGWNAFGALIGRYENFNVLGGDDFEPFDWGFVLQGGYRFAPETEIFARFDAIMPDDDERGFDEDFFPFITVGVNQYYAGHAAKASVDLLWALEATDELAGTGFNSTGLGLSGSTEDNEFVIRLQFQLLF